ncbi:MAG: TolC family protein [Myxococcota bacterium]
MVFLLPLCTPVSLWAQTAELPSPLRLEDVPRLARERRAEVAAAKARAVGTAQRPATVSALEDPMVSPSVDHWPFGMPAADVSLGIEQRFPLSGIRGHRRRAAEAEFQRVRAEVDQVGLDVELDATSAFLMLEERRQSEVILEEQRALAVQFVRAATARYAAGTGAQADVLRAQIEVARLEGALRSIAAEVRAAEAMLNTSLGQPATAALPPLDSSVALTPPSDARAVRDAAFSRRPELRAGLAEVSRAQAEVSVMQSMYSPMAVVRTGPASTMAEGVGWMLMVGISVPIWRERLRAGVAEAEAMVKMAEADLEAMRRMVDGDAVASREQVLAARERLIALKDEVVPRAKQAIDPTLAGYAAGQVPLVSVIEAAQALWSAQAELVMAQFSLGVAWARFRRAVGGGGASPP